jgi:hypothetical protein
MASIMADDGIHWDIRSPMAPEIFRRSNVAENSWKTDTLEPSAESSRPAPPDEMTTHELSAKSTTAEPLKETGDATIAAEGGGLGSTCVAEL